MASISLQEEAAILELNEKRAAYAIKNKVRKSYYEGTVVPPSIRIGGGAKNRVVESSVGWAKTAVDAKTERLDFQGFQSADEDNPYGLNDIASANSLSTTASEVHRDAGRYGTTFVSVANGDGYYEPEVLIAAHDPHFATANFDLRSKQLRVGLTVFPDEPNRGELLTPESVIPFGIFEGKVFLDGERADHGLNRVPMVQFSNNPDAGSSRGHSDITVPMMKQIDFVIRTMDSIEANREFYAWGQRYITTDREFKDRDGNPIDPFVAAMQSMWKVPLNSDKTSPQIGTLPSNSPKDLLDLLRVWGQMFASEAGLPEHYLGVTPTANPTSADAIRAGESRLIIHTKQKINAFARPWAEVGTLAVLLRDGSLPENYKAPSPVWGEISTVAAGASADRALKLVSAGIVQPTSRVVLSELGYTKAQQDTIVRENNAATGGMLRRLLESESAVEEPSIPPIEEEVSLDKEVA